MTFHCLKLCSKTILVLEGGYNIVESCYAMRWCLETLLTGEMNYEKSEEIKTHEWARIDIQNTLNCLV